VLLAQERHIGRQLVQRRLDGLLDLDVDCGGEVAITLRDEGTDVRASLTQDIGA
jgi:hypothetical protein